MVSELAPTYVIDASVVLRWHLLNPPYLDACLRVRDDFEQGRIHLVAPDNFRYEVGGGIRRAVSMRRITATQGEQHINDFNAFDIPVMASTGLLLPTYQLSIRLGCGFYDAFYLVMAQRENLPFIHADHNLQGALQGRFPLERWIEDY